MLGDWVNLGNPIDDKIVPTKIKNIYGEEINCKTGHTNDDVPTILSGKWLRYAQPIPLTEEILVKNGFGKVYNQYFFGQVEIEELRDCWFVTIIKEDADIDINIHYVHTLQHLLRLCGIEKEIEL